MYLALIDTLQTVLYLVYCRLPFLRTSHRSGRLHLTCETKRKTINTNFKTKMQNSYNFNIKILKLVTRYLQEKKTLSKTPSSPAELEKLSLNTKSPLKYNKFEQRKIVVKRNNKNTDAFYWTIWVTRLCIVSPLFLISIVRQQLFRVRLYILLR